MNIWSIKQNLLSIFDELEENGGELTPELEEELKVTQQSFREKIKDYANVIKSLSADLKTIKEETKRLKALHDRKEKTIAKLKSIIVEAIEEFGDTNKNGVSYIDYGSGQVVIRKSTAVEVDEDNVKKIGKAMDEVLGWMRFNKQLDTVEELDYAEFLDILSQDVEDTDEGLISGIVVDKEELDSVNFDVTLSIPVSKLFKADGYDIIKSILKGSDNYKLGTSVSKSLVKDDLLENGSCLPHIARLVSNKNVLIK